MFTDLLLMKVHSYDVNMQVFSLCQTYNLIFSADIGGHFGLKGSYEEQLKISLLSYVA